MNANSSKLWIDLIFIVENFSVNYFLSHHTFVPPPSGPPNSEIPLCTPVGLLLYSDCGKGIRRTCTAVLIVPLLLLLTTGKSLGYPVRRNSAHPSGPSGYSAIHFCVIILSRLVSKLSAAFQAILTVVGGVAMLLPLCPLLSVKAAGVKTLLAE